MRRSDGEIVFVDYCTSGRIGAPGNFAAAARVPLSPPQPVAERGRGGKSTMSWHDFAIALAAGLSVVAAVFASRFRRGGRPSLRAIMVLSFASAGWSGYLIYGRFAGDGAVGQWHAIAAIAAAALLCLALWPLRRARGTGGVEREAERDWGEELVYSRWPEDWSQLKRLVDSMSEAERLSLRNQIESNPDWLDDARALIRRPARGGLSELRGSAAFGKALAAFARREALNEWRGMEGEDREVRVRHLILPGALADWSQVIVEASLFDALELSQAASEAVAEDAAAATPQEAAKKKRQKRKKRKRSLGDIAADVGFFDIRWLFDSVARRIVADGAATRLELDAAEGLRMPGDAEELGIVLEDVLRATLAAEQSNGAAPPSLAVMAYEDAGEIRFIALRGETEAAERVAVPLSGDVLARANEAARRTGGRVWVESGENEQICSFTLSGEAPSPPVRRRAGRRTGWRPAHTKAVWSMGSQGDAPRY